MKIASLILIGGKSSRMGQPKHLLKFQELTFLSTIQNAFRSIPTYVSVSEIVDNIDINTQIVDEHKEIGPIGGIYSAFKNIHCEYLFVCSCDTPLVDTSLVNEMVVQSYLNPGISIIAKTDRIHPTFAIYHRSAFKQIESNINNSNYRLMTLIDNIDYQCYELESDKYHKLSNINTPADYLNFNKPFVFAVSGYKNSGKTTLINKLILKFREHDYTVGALKHDGHDFEIRPDTDTGKFINSAASTCTIYSQKKIMTVTNEAFNLGKFISDNSHLDVIIVEGMKDSKLSKIEITNSVSSNFPNTFLKTGSQDVISKFNDDDTWVHRDDINCIFEFILKEMNEGQF